VVLLALQARSYLSVGVRPTELQGGTALTYRIDLNSATLAELLQLPGVGPKMAARIEHYRIAKGGFRSTDELLKVGGIGLTTLERLRPWVCVGSDDEEEDETEPPAVAVRKTVPMKAGQPAAVKPLSSKEAALKGAVIDLNRASLQDLQRLPGIGAKMAQRIVDERSKRRFATVEELRRVAGIGPKTLTRLQPYLRVEKKRD
jgi:competence protein ComEA